MEENKEKSKKKRLLRIGEGWWIGEDRFIKVKIKVKDETTLTTDHLLITGWPQDDAAQSRFDYPL